MTPRGSAATEVALSSMPAALSFRANDATIRRSIAAMFGICDQCPVLQ